MSRLNYSVNFNPNTKIWTNNLPINEESKKENLGKIVLKKLSEFDPNKIIEINADSDIKTTAQEMKSLAITLALNLQKLGIQQGDIIMFFSSMNPLTTPLIYACSIIGAIYVPTETLYDDDIIEYVLELVNPNILIYDYVHNYRLSKLMKKQNLTKLMHFLSWEPNDNGNSVLEKLLFCNYTEDVINTFEPPNLGNPEDITLALTFTSGTTGKPKLFVQSHAAIALGAVTYWDVDESNIIYTASPFRWITQNSAIFQPILQNCTRVYATEPPTPKVCAENIRKYKVTHFFSVSTLMKQVLEYVYDIKGNHIASLIQILTGGERVPDRIVNMIKEINPLCSLVLCYGMTELSGTIGNNIGCKKDGGYYIGRGLECKIIDENKQPLKPNQCGVICIRNKIRFGGYWKDATKDKECLSDDGWLCTTDYGKMDDDNELYVYNRHSELIKSNGVLIIPYLIENTLDSHPLVKGGFVVGVQHMDSSKGEIPVAFCTLNEDKFKESKITQKEAETEILTFLKLNLPKDQILPSKIFFLNDLPYTTCGKVDKTELRKIGTQYFVTVQHNH